MDHSSVHVGRAALFLDMDVALGAQGTATTVIHRHIASVPAMQSKVNI